MTFGKRISVWTVSGLACLAAACSSSSSSGDDSVVVESVTQDLDADPDGLTTVIVFDDSPGSINAGHLRSNGGQDAVLVIGSGRTFTVTWDARVTPSNRVKVVGKSGVEEDWERVVTTDDSVPTFAMGVGVQDTADAALGGDQLTVTFSGPRVVETQAEDPDNWDLVVNGTSVDLTGSVFDLDPVTQIMSMTFGPGANLHSTFTLAATSLGSVADVQLDTSAQAGTAAGDAAAPTLVSVEQILIADEYGLVVDFVFNEPMDPDASPSIANFSVNDGPGAVGVTLVTEVTQPDSVTLRASFNNPVVPGFDTITHTGLMDAHGNVFTAGTVAVGNAGAQANAYDSVVGTTVANAGNDTITITTDQALDPDFAIDPALWTIDVDGGTITMADQTLDYDLLAKTLTVELDFDMRNGDTIDVTSLGVQEVDGQLFAAAAGTVNADGDVDPPAAVSATQNRTVDPNGLTVDVAFDEDLDPVTAVDPNNYSFAPVVGINTVTLLAGGDTVRIEALAVMTPGDYTMTIDQDVEDLAGNPMVADQGPVALVSTDVDPPLPMTISGSAIEGADDDTVIVAFDDELVQLEIEDPLNWNLESPVGTILPLTAPTVRWDRASRTATLVLDEGGQALQAGDDIGVSFTTLRDIGGNVVDPNPITGVIQAESGLPAVDAVWRMDPTNDGTVVVRFTEPCGNLDDLYHAVSNPNGTRYAIRLNDFAQTLRGYPTTVNIVDGGLGVELNYGFTVNLTDTLDVIGVTDLAGNIMFPAMDQVIIAEDVAAPDHNVAPTVTALSGENNDVIIVEFTTMMSPWKLTSPSSYSVVTNPGGVVVDLEAATFELLSRTTVQITLDATNSDNVDASELYDVTFVLDADNPLQSEQGVPLAASSTLNVSVGGDNANGPTQVGSRVIFSSAIDDEVAYFIFDEAVSEAAVEADINDWLYNGVQNPTGALELVSPRVVRLDFETTLTPGFNVGVFQPATEDLAGNDAGGMIILALQDDASAPLLTNAAGEVDVGSGGDRVVIGFNEEIDLATGLNLGNYAVTNGISVDLSSATIAYDSVATAVTITLPVGVELDANNTITVSVMGVADAAGNAIVGTSMLGGVVTGDVTAPSVANAWTNLPLDAAGTTIDILFTEDVDQDFLQISQGNWSTSGSANVIAIEFVSPAHARIQLNAPLGVAETIDISAGLQDMAQNAAGAISFDPVDPVD
ncbi:MAG: Ig-like domain-containing protein [bacterium]|nr:Ig-like domain-containing protein [bacterium]